MDISISLSSRICSVQTRCILKTSVDLQGVFVKISDSIQFEGFLVEFLREQALLRKSKTPRKSSEKWIFLSLAFYNAPSLIHTPLPLTLSGHKFLVALWPAILRFAVCGHKPRMLRWHVCRVNFERKIFCELRILLRKMLRNFPEILSLCSVGQKKSRKIPSKFPTKFSKFPCEKLKKKNTDERGTAIVPLSTIGTRYGNSVSTVWMPPKPTTKLSLN